MCEADIYCEHNPSPAKLEVLGVYDWPIWKKAVSTFPWRYDVPETCYFLRGRVIVTPDQGTPQEFRRGDLVTFPAGLACTWEILEAVEKHYDFGNAHS
ncbi:Cupin [Gammaproteobacteria bacterium]